MYSTSDLKRGTIVDMDDAPHLVEALSVSSPTARGGNRITKVRFRNLKTGAKVDKTLRGSEQFGVPDIDKRKVDYLYDDPQAYHFMDVESFEQFAFDRKAMEWDSKFLIAGAEGLVAFYYNGSPIALELPPTVALTITETAPGVKGNSATGRTKPATLETGHVVQLPEHFDNDVKVNVDTRTGEYLGRAN